MNTVDANNGADEENRPAAEVATKEENPPKPLEEVPCGNERGEGKGIVLCDPIPEDVKNVCASDEEIEEKGRSSVTADGVSDSLKPLLQCAADKDDAPPAANTKDALVALDELLPKEKGDSGERNMEPAVLLLGDAVAKAAVPSTWREVGKHVDASVLKEEGELAKLLNCKDRLLRC